MNDEQKARQAVRDYLTRALPYDVNEAYLSKIAGIFQQLDHLDSMIERSETDTAAWDQCLTLLNAPEGFLPNLHNVAEPPGIPEAQDDPTAAPAFRHKLQKWAFRALQGEIKRPTKKGRPEKPITKHALAMATYRAARCGLPIYNNGNATRISACKIVAEVAGCSEPNVQSAWKEYVERLGDPFQG